MANQQYVISYRSDEELLEATRARAIESDQRTVRATRGIESDEELLRATGRRYIYEINAIYDINAIYRLYFGVYRVYLVTRPNIDVTRPNI